MLNKIDYDENVFFSRTLFATVSVMVLGAALVSTSVMGYESQSAAQVLAEDFSAKKATANISDDSEIMEIIVTSQRRKERLQDIPISVQVLTGESMQKANVTSLNKMVEQVPSVHISGEAGGGRANELFIRGVGSGNNQSFDQSVGMFIDDIYHGRSRISAATFLDLKRVEILKGPQSTYFGNNAIAGAFNIITRKPGQDFEANARVLYGEDDQYTVEAAAGGPITDTIGVRVAGIASGSNGWLKNINTGTNVPKEDNIVGRGTIVYKPNEDFDITVKAEISDKKNKGGWAVQVTDCPPAAPFTAGGTCAVRIGLGLPTGLDNNIIADSAGEEIKLKTHDYMLSGNLKVGEATLTSITGYSSYKSKMHLDGDFTPLSLVNINAPERYHQFSQELRLVSESGKPIEYLLGSYYQYSKLNVHQDITFYLVSPAIMRIPPFAPLIPFLPLASSIDFQVNEKSYALFGSLTWNMTDQLAFTGGVRATWVEKDFTQDIFYGTGTEVYGGSVPIPDGLQPLAQALGLGAVPGTLNSSRSDSAFLPSIKAQYHLRPEVMLYVSYAKGFKSGGFNGADQSGVLGNVRFEPEHVDAYEIGIKSGLFDRRLVLNMAAFLSDYNDLQVVAQENGGGLVIQSIVRNAASVRSQGFELEAQWSVTHDFMLSFVGTYLDSHYSSFPNGELSNIQSFCRNNFVLPECGGLPNPVPFGQDLSGRPTAFAPKWSGNMTARYGFDINDSLRLTIEGSAVFSSSYYLSSTDDELVKQDSYVRFDTNISLGSADGRWAFDIIGKNLNNRIIKTFSQSLPTTIGSAYAAKQRPRTFVAQIRFNW